MVNINFKSENLKVDFLSFNTQFNDENQIQIIADYFSDKFKCNSQFEDKQNPNLNRTLVKKKENYLKVFFRANQVKYWSGISIDFTGNDANEFYQALKLKELDWDIIDFHHTNLGRIDLCYDRKIEESDSKEDFNLFLESCKNQINERYPLTLVEINENILRVGSRKSPNFFRVYKRQNGREIRFELEIKKLIAKKYQSYLFLNQFEEFEHILSKHFYRQSLKIFVLKNHYSDWLLNNFRKAKNNNQDNQDNQNKLGDYSLPNFFSTSYINSTNSHSFYSNSSNDLDNYLDNDQILYKSLQLLNYLNYLRSLNSTQSTQIIGNQKYRIISFPLISFIKFINKDKDKITHYKKANVIKFLQSLQKLNPLIEYSSDNLFRSAVVFPYFEIKKHKSWYVEILVADQLFSYSYPFNFPKSFLIYKDIYDLQVKLLFIKSFAKTDVEKTIKVDDFLIKFNVPNSQITKIKDYIVNIIHQLVDSNLIEPTFMILTKEDQIREIKGVDQLTTKLIGKCKIITYTEIY